MRVSCAMCGDGFEAKRPTARFCSPRCKQRAHRQPGGSAATPSSESLAEPTDIPDEVPGLLAAATMAELEAGGRLDSAAGQAVMVLARRIDAASRETGSSLAALVREHRAALAAAVANAESVTDPVDELRKRRDHKLAG